jgi:peptide/nickel transport system substrate-binding protein
MTFLRRFHSHFDLRAWCVIAVFSVSCGMSAAAEPRPSIAMHGEPKHAAGFAHWPYVNPDAPKRGRVNLGVMGSFDSLNPLIYKGESVSGVREYVYESLMLRGADEPFSLYGLIAETIDVPPDRGSVTFTLRKAARFSDGKPITADDVIFSYKLLLEKGWPFMRRTYKAVARAERLGDHAVKFVFEPDSGREIALLMGLMPIVPKHLIDPETFERTSLVPPVGSGPYRVARVEPGRTVVFTRNPDWWAKDLPVARGRYNFDEIRVEHFREETAMFEAFKSGQIDTRTEDLPSRWLDGYKFPAALDGRVVMREVETRLPAVTTALAFNTRRPPFDDPKLRRALIGLYDFEWINKSLYGGVMRRTESFFERSELSSLGRAADERERALLAPFASTVRPEIMAGHSVLPVTDGNGNMRALMQAAMRDLSMAGYRLEGRQLFHPKTNTSVVIEFLSQSRGQERLVQSYAKILGQIGITLSIRQVDSAQYEKRLKDQDYDMIQTSWNPSLSPGVEQLNWWSSAAADATSTRNYAGVKNPAADAMMAALVAAESRETFTSAIRALDRVLRSGDYVIPLHHLPRTWLAHWSHIKGPDVRPDAATNAGFNLDTWWSERR